MDGIRHPISVARLVMEKTDHVLIAGSHATKLAQHFKLEEETGSGQAVPRATKAGGTARQSKTLKLYQAMKQYDTVGAVVLDGNGTVAAGASTGGFAVMLPGRVGDTSLIGSGVYADNECGAVSMTGHGESIMRLVVAKQIAIGMKNGASPKRAGQRTLDELVRRIRGAAAGALVVAPDGRFAIRHTTPWMCAGYWNGRGTPVVADRFP